MYLTEALRVNGKAKRETVISFYASFEDGEIVFRDIKKNMTDTVCQEIISSDLNDDWQPYEPEPEKCEACKEAKSIEDLSSNSFSPMADHLRRFHCTCKED